ncbi:hypothetical protein HGRIS_005423 [Hohenbuehelia grisea]|uniref:beta-glucosidase n=1 Tax=Hohenbuehelia grisea TaxID=104357 RepID=A0ABR3JXT3_9AGAR
MAVVGLDAKMPGKDCGDLNTCNKGTITTGWGSGSNSLEFVVPPIDAITAVVGDSALISQSLSNKLDDGVAAARGKDLAFVFVNANSGELGAYTVVDGNMADRNNLDLWFKGGSLVERVAAVCNNTIVVVHSTGPVRMPWSNHANISAIVYAGAPGEQNGPGLVDDESAYGTEIVYNSLGFPNIDYTEKLLLDYRYMDAHNIAPRFEFGFGLSYTTFAYSGLMTSFTSSDGKSMLTTQFTVTNNGSVAGTEIAQLYLSFPESASEGGF